MSAPSPLLPSPSRKGLLASALASSPSRSDICTNPSTPDIGPAHEIGIVPGLVKDYIMKFLYYNDRVHIQVDHKSFRIQVDIYMEQSRCLPAIDYLLVNVMADRPVIRLLKCMEDTHKTYIRYEFRWCHRESISEMDSIVYDEARKS